jgi:hypothetical protein
VKVAHDTPPGTNHGCDSVKVRLLSTVVWPDAAGIAITNAPMASAAAPPNAAILPIAILLVWRDRGGRRNLSP